MTWLKSRFARVAASVAALVPVVSWSSSCTTSDAYGCADPGIADFKACCELLNENQAYVKMCQDMVEHADYSTTGGCKFDCIDVAYLKRDVGRVADTCREYAADQSNAKSWKTCVHDTLAQK